MIRQCILMFCVVQACSFIPNYFRPLNIVARPTRQYELCAKQRDLNEEYTNPLTQFLGLFLKETTDVISECDSINWKAPKRKKTSMDRLAKDLEVALNKKEWFVTGNVDPSFFDSGFAFQDPDVKLKGIENYARGVNKLFEQQGPGKTRAEIIAVRVANPTTITVTWRLEGRVKLGPGGVSIRAFVVYSDLTVDTKSGLITFQLDRFSIKGNEIILGALPFNLPFVRLPPPAARVEELRREFLNAEKKVGKK